MSLETWQARYPTFVGEEFQNRSLRQTMAIRKETEPGAYIWTARLSTGLFGKHDCPSGNASYAPKGPNDLLVLVGQLGLETAIDLGFIPCEVCHPEGEPHFWENAEEAIQWNYPELPDVKQFADKKVVPYDIRNVSWESITPYMTAFPNRLYLPRNLTEQDLKSFKVRFSKFGFEIPPVGYYDRDASGHFFEYKLP